MLISPPNLLYFLIVLFAVTCVNGICFHTIKVVDKDTGRGVPCVNFTTTNLISQYSDSNGVIAFHEPGLMGSLVWFSVAADGYLFESKDPFRFIGLQINVSCNGKTIVPVKRLQIAQRLYRITGEGIYRDSYLANEPVRGIDETTIYKKFLLNTQIMGQDSVHTAIYRKRYFWIWGDTNRVSYPLGNFLATGATSSLQPQQQGFLDVEHGVLLDYFSGADGFVRPVAPLGVPGKPVWLHGLATETDAGGRETLYTTYFQVNSDWTTNERGIAMWSDEKQEFKLVTLINDQDLSYPISGSHTLRAMDPETSIEYFYFGNPYIEIRVVCLVICVWCMLC